MDTSAKDIFDAPLMKAHKVQPEDCVVAIDGKDVDLKLLNHNEVGSDHNDFRFFYLRRNAKRQPFYRLAICCHQPGKSSQTSCHESN